MSGADETAGIADFLATKVRYSVWKVELPYTSMPKPGSEKKMAKIHKV